MHWRSHWRANLRAGAIRIIAAHVEAYVFGISRLKMLDEALFDCDLRGVVLKEEEGNSNTGFYRRKFI